MTPGAGALCLGIDLGTTGCRVVAVAAHGQEAGAPVAEAAVPLPAPDASGPAVRQDPAAWWQGLAAALGALGARVDLARARALALDGTSASLLVTDAAGCPLAPARMYSDAACAQEAARVAQHAPAGAAARGATASLAKLLRFQAEHPDAAHALHQADWVAGRLLGRWDRGDENNALKLGWDPEARRWPAWLDALGVRRDLLPAVHPPGTPLGTLAAGPASELGLPRGCVVAAGTTDSVAGFLATGADMPGDAVTSLGTTLALKLLSTRPVADAARGVYSHRLGDRWLAGGASNTGGGALLACFPAERLPALTAALEPERPTGLDYHPLPRPGERFPVADPELAPRMEPRPADDARFFQGLLEGIARIEAEGYRALEALGAPPLRRVLTVGGGAANPGWTRIRARTLGVPVESLPGASAALGAARLAREALARAG